MKATKKYAGLVEENQCLDYAVSHYQKRLQAAEGINAKLRQLIADDDFAATFQSMALYRKALLKAANSTADPDAAQYVPLFTQ